MIESAVFSHPFEDKYIQHPFDHADGGSIPLRIPADFAQFPFSDVVTLWTIVDPLLQGQDRTGQLLKCL